MLSFKTRLDCPASYATEDTPDLLCRYGGVCDGTMYYQCLWDRDFGEQMEIIAENETLKEVHFPKCSKFAYVDEGAELWKKD